MMPPFRLSLLGLGLALSITASIPTYAAPKDETGCGTDLVCAASPQTIASALQKAGYTAELTKDNLGDPMINSAAAGYKFSILFYDCTEHVKCESLQFYASYDANEKITADYVNKWNNEKRFVSAIVNDEHELTLRYDVATIGGINQTNFKDILDWWSTLLGDYSNFSKENLN
ncbi:YbjN domain-containing protein [Sphingobium sp. BYY-5]|uniref:YbjN domain-containing protein n=1 Tax=Sphingobium sp. BYY-5 TaxID=2926400 RepID=UPI001FA6B1E7|nr:YbjN domain-containing protein [Sphingobium sp. BYY-5]MCI4589912.1 YbjN domain-containing protein [Sphingobium sp. BYY-5]